MSPPLIPSYQTKKNTTKNEKAVSLMSTDERKKSSTEF